MKTIAELTRTNAKSGSVEWIGVRPARREPMDAVDTIDLTINGVVGDHYQSAGKRSITLIQYEHLAVIAAFLGLKAVNPCDLRRNLVVSGINLLGLRNRQFRIGNAILEGTGLCAPCSRMEEILGTGGYAAVRGHGGITAKIVKAGPVSISDAVIPV
ncbi:MAG: MOSC domain-containing protein [Pseudomonadota bacterium]